MINNNNNVERKVYVGNVDIETIGKEVDFPPEVLIDVAKEDPDDFQKIFEAFTDKYNVIDGNLELPSLGIKTFNFGELIEITGDVILADNELTDLQFASLKKIGGYLDLRNNEFTPKDFETTFANLQNIVLDDKLLMYNTTLHPALNFPQNFAEPQIPKGEHHIYFYGRVGWGGVFVGSNGLEFNCTFLKPIEYEILWQPSTDEAKQRLSNGKSALTPITLYPEQNITILPFSYREDNDMILNSIEESINLIEANKIREKIVFPLQYFKVDTKVYYDNIGSHKHQNELRKEKELAFKAEWCCSAHYMLSLIKRVLKNMGYSSEDVDLDEKSPLPIFGELTKQDGTKLNIEATAGQ